MSSNFSAAERAYASTIHDAVKKYITDYLSPESPSFESLNIPPFVAPPFVEDGFSLTSSHVERLREMKAEYERAFNIAVNKFKRETHRRFGRPRLRLPFRSYPRPNNSIGFFRPEDESERPDFSAPIQKEIPIINGPELFMKRNSQLTDIVDFEEFQNGETVEITYDPKNKQKFNRGETVNIKPAMILRPTSVEGIIKNAKETDKKIINPSTRLPIALRERRTLRLVNSPKNNTSPKNNNTLPKNNTPPKNNNKPSPRLGSSQEKKGFRFSTKFPYFKTRKNRKSYRKKH